MATSRETKKTKGTGGSMQSAACIGSVPAGPGEASASIVGTMWYRLTRPGEKARTHVTKELGKWVIKFRKKGASEGFIIHAAVKQGIGIDVADALKVDLHINDKQMAEALGTSESTLLRLRKAGKDLDEVASDRLVRYARILEIATEVFDDAEKAQSWLKRPQFGLAGEIPLELMKSEVGAREVENLLMRIEHGVLA
jgi:putative toxin-antitoxin system antitoxin component (TIGR02293 family)